MGEEARLGKFAVSNDFDAASNLLAYDVGHGTAQRLLKGRFVVRLPGIFRLHHVRAGGVAAAGCRYA